MNNQEDGEGGNHHHHHHLTLNNNKSKSNSNSIGTGNISQIGNEAQMAPLLSAVSCEEDRGLVLDVLAAIKACRQPEQLCVSWSVSPAAGK
jgi:hypothetical protein